MLYFCEKKKKWKNIEKKGDVGMLVGWSTSARPSKSVTGDGKGPFSPCANFTLASIERFRNQSFLKDGKRETHERPKVGVAPTATI